MIRNKQAESKAFLDWLSSYTRLPIEEWGLKTMVKAYWQQTWDELGRALRQNRKVIEKASGKNVERREARHVTSHE